MMNANFYFCPKFRFLNKTLAFHRNIILIKRDKKDRFLSKILICIPNFDFYAKFLFVPEILIFSPKILSFIQSLYLYSKFLFLHEILMFIQNLYV